MLINWYTLYVMKKIILIIVFLGIIGAGWYLISPLFINQTINEELPIISSFTEKEAEDIVAIDRSLESLDEFDVKISDNIYQKPIAREVQIKDVITSETSEMNDIIVGQDLTVEDPMMPTTPEMSIESRGSFVGADNAHQGSGDVKIIRDGEKTFLRFEDFSVTNGPDLFVTLNKGDSAKSDHVLLRSLKGNKGNQNYDISNYDIDDYQSVSIYCRAFSVVFATATL